ncbi:MAG: hypothetical protein IPF92_21275 [Myxococcales bacterium]|nr:hypothetical protein [Myxococcales bacterium]MBL0197530.1 hypothetical protein [Myxococcales bacterium]HQY61405.1 hypothetical protein [Polyangiaceae bacterium]
MNDAKRPRVGSIVWVRVARWPGGPHTDHAALVTRVSPTGNVDLASFEPGRTELTTMGDRSFDPTGQELGTWRWPED